MYKLVSMFNLINPQKEKETITFFFGGGEPLSQSSCCTLPLNETLSPVHHHFSEDQEEGESGEGEGGTSG
jgi:hypothetical protein